MSWSPLQRLHNTFRQANMCLLTQIEVTIMLLA